MNRHSTNNLRMNSASGRSMLNDKSLAPYGGNKAQRTSGTI